MAVPKTHNLLSFKLFMFTVRSLASVSLRKSLKDRTLFHFDFFTVDLHEEYSALLGGKNAIAYHIFNIKYWAQKSYDLGFNHNLLILQIFQIFSISYRIF